ncbi:Transcriptional regulator BlaI [Rubripirellula tenax]|uniref:Transcriptional regulator BlaI n=1 Tax=Rubripirellula tenax TaxID=2528015 RepID=A0A5C6EHS7_9BACT|nr:BlaI/MecI/CopY family transcriptional regulator [Rubripirellula tenax]TWU47597.1 Transcriptional regulator BlaI [Rubripirellula tenax]
MANANPSELELLILKVIWEQSPLTARQIRESLESRGRVLAHTSVITMLQRMAEKKLVEQVSPESGKGFLFAPLVAADEVSNHMLRDLVHRVFDGSAEAVVESLFDVSDLNEESLKRLRKTFNQRMREHKNE